MKIIKLLLLITLTSFLLSGCIAKALMPYEEEPLCNKGKESGYCGSVSSVYEAIIEEENYRR